MKLRLVISSIITFMILSLCFFSQASSMDDPGFMIKRMVMSEEIADKEPFAIGDTFSADTEKVYCFLEAREIENDTTVSFVWYLEDEEMARVTLPLVKGMRWRTYSSKKLAGRKGNWKVELQESSGIVLHSVSFQVQ
ncbi:MAG: DUF2914 domain-containing protein [Deltaproteobacteria bacterium]|jgi:hypothetical protein|nr:MAG: DUF2914 domain-containing protein [Deltaproteobacteria bacterium]